MRPGPFLFFLLLALTPGCAWAPGTGFATLTEAELGLSAALPPGRLDMQGRWKTNTGWRVALDAGRLEVQFGPLGLEGAARPRTAGAGGTFDPANPPPGYGLCHGGHCHRDDGALIDYADIQAELDGQGGAAAATSLVRLVPPGRPEPLTLGAVRALRLDTCQPHCHLPQTAVAAVTLAATALAAEGSVSPPDEGPSRRFVVKLPLSGLTWRARLASPVAVSAEGAARLRLEASWALPDTLFDDLPWDTLLANASAAPVELTADRATRDRLQDHLREGAFRGALRAFD